MRTFKPVFSHFTVLYSFYVAVYLGHKHRKGFKFSLRFKPSKLVEVSTSLDFNTFSPKSQDKFLPTARGRKDKRCEKDCKCADSYFSYAFCVNFRVCFLYFNKIILKNCTLALSAYFFYNKGDDFCFRDFRVEY